MCAKTHKVRAWSLTVVSGGEFHFESYTFGGSNPKLHEVQQLVIAGSAEGAGDAVVTVADDVQLYVRHLRLEVGGLRLLGILVVLEVGAELAAEVELALLPRDGELTVLLAALIAVNAAWALLMVVSKAVGNENTIRKRNQYRRRFRTRAPSPSEHLREASTSLR